MNDQTIADDLRAVFARFISAGEAELVILSLWTIHTHALRASPFTPYLAITSAEKGSGKTRVLEVLHTVVRSPLMCASISPAAVARSVDKEQPTLLLDELDALLKGEKEMAESVRGILNSGFHISGQFIRMAGAGAQMEARRFSTFSPKAFAGIGSLPDTLANRSITIRLQRAVRGTRERFRPDGMGKAAKLLRLELNGLKKRAAAWAEQNIKLLADAEPTCPDAFLDRQCDIAEPLLSIADALGAGWPQKARQALTTLFSSPAAEDTSIGVKLLTDIKDVFAASETDRLSSADLVSQLVEIETSPWGEWRHGKSMTPRNLASQLKKYGISPRTIRTEAGVVAKGYTTDLFRDAWLRYVNIEGCNGSCNGSKSEVSANVYAVCNPVTDEKGGRQKGGNGNSLISALPACGKCGSFALYKAPSGIVCMTCTSELIKQ